MPVVAIQDRPMTSKMATKLSLLDNEKKIKEFEEQERKKVLIENDFGIHLFSIIILSVFEEVK
jgi:hypothetical protein